MVLSVLYVTADEIQALFNEGDYFERFLRGEFFPEVYRIGPSPPGAPKGGYSQTVRYLTLDRRRTIAVVHQRAGDALGNPLGSDRPDPKRLVHRGVDYRFSAELERLRRGW